MNIITIQAARAKKMEERQGYYQEIYQFLKGEGFGNAVTKSEDVIAAEVKDPEASGYRSDPDRVNLPSTSLDITVNSSAKKSDPWYKIGEAKVQDLLAMQARLNDFGIKSRVRPNVNTILDSATMDSPVGDGIERLVIDTEQDGFAANIQRLKNYTLLKGGSAVGVSAPATPPRQLGE